MPGQSGTKPSRRGALTRAGPGRGFADGGRADGRLRPGTGLTRKPGGTAHPMGVGEYAAVAWAIVSVVCAVVIVLTS
jgi:hypothetical protein